MIESLSAPVFLAYLFESPTIVLPTNELHEEVNLNDLSD